MTADEELVNGLLLPGFTGMAVHVGLPGAWTPPAPSVTLWGDGRAHADVAADLLAQPLDQA